MTDRMKIGFDAKRYYHNNTGLGNYSRTLVGSMQRMFPENEYVLYDEKSMMRTFRLGHKAAADGCTLYHGLSNELPQDIKGMVPSVVTMHDVCWRTYPEMYHFIDRQLYDLKYGSSCRRADKVVAISESTKHDLMHIYGISEERIEVIYQPVAENYYMPLGDGDGLLSPELTEYISSGFILFVGSINRRKNLMAVVKALAMMKKENRPRLVVVGNGREYRREVETFIHQHGLDDYVRIETNIHDNMMLQRLYSKARVMVYPSFYEGFGLPVVEAALQQTPVITSTVSSLPEAAGPDACLVDPHAADCPERIANLLDRLLSDDAEAKRVGQSMERYCRQAFDPDTLTRQMMELYRSII